MRQKDNKKGRERERGRLSFIRVFFNCVTATTVNQKNKKQKEMKKMVELDRMLGTFIGIDENFG